MVYGIISFLFQPLVVLFQEWHGGSGDKNVYMLLLAPALLFQDGGINMEQSLSQTTLT